MRTRRRSDEEAIRPEAPAAAFAPAPAELLLRLQQGAGNARVSRLLARTPVEDAERATEVAPHEPGDRGEDLLALGPGAFGGGTQLSAAPDVAPPQPDPLDVWLKKQPATNAEMAAWVLEAEQHGFVKFNNPFYRAQMAALAAGKTEVAVFVGSGVRGKQALDAAKPLGVLVVLTGLARARAERWVANPVGDKPAVEAGDLIRNLQGKITDAHASGASGDLFQHFDWEGAGGPAQVIEVLEDLPKGRYSIGLPMQGQFFPREEYLAERQRQAVAAAGAGGTPADITQPSLVYWTTSFYTSKYDPAPKDPKYPWSDTQGSAGVVTRLRSAALKDRLKSLAGEGTAIEVFPDFDNHIHVTRR